MFYHFLGTVGVVPGNPVIQPAVENAEVRYHIVRLDPTDPARINLRELNELKFTMNA